MQKRIRNLTTYVPSPLMYHSRADDIQHGGEYNAFGEPLPTLYFIGEEAKRSVEAGELEAMLERSTHLVEGRPD